MRRGGPQDRRGRKDYRERSRVFTVEPRVRPALNRETPMIQPIKAVLLALPLALCMAGPVAADGGVEIPPNACAAQIDGKLTELKINRADLDRISVSPRRDNHNDDNQRTVGIDVWVRYKVCPGSLVLDLSTDCRVNQAYTRGRCSVPGVRAY